MKEKNYLRFLVAVLGMLALTTGQKAKAQTEEVFAGFTATAGTVGYNNQSYDNLVDGKFTSSDGTKWCLAMSGKTVLAGQTEPAVYCEFNATVPIEVTKYILTTGDDNATWKNRNPKRWALQGKLNSNDAWITLDSIAGDDTMQDVNFTNYEFTIAEPGICQYFRFLVYENKGDGSLQLCELRLVGSEATEKYPRPANLAATLTPGNGTTATLTWTERGTATKWILQYGTDNTFADGTYTEATITDGPTKTLTGLTAETTYYARVKSVYEDDESYWSTVIIFKPTNIITLTVNDDTSTNDKVPVYGLWTDNYSQSQFIIEAADLSAMSYGIIKQLTFYSSNTNIGWGAAQFEVYVKEVGNTTFSATTLVDWDSMDKMMNSAGLSIDNYGKMVVTLDDNYQYMGGNLLIGIRQTTSGTYQSCGWYGKQVTNAAIGGYEGSLSIQNFLPKTTFSYIQSELPSCFKPKALKTTNVTRNSATLQWKRGSSDQTMWDVAYKPVDQPDYTLIEEVTDTTYTLTGLNPETEYVAKVRGNCGDGDVSEWCDSVFFTTDVAFPAPQKLKSDDVTPHSAVISWDANEASGFNLRYKNAEIRNTATIILRADDVWGDGSGYQMLIDADATAYGNLIPETGPLSSSGDVDASVYGEFEYKIPENADGALSTTNILCDASDTIVIPAGTYDWCITNPTPGDRLWISSAGGNVGGRYDDYVFEAGKIYEFHVYYHESSGNDAVDVTIMTNTNDPNAFILGDGEWTEVNNVTSPYTLTGLDPETLYVVHVQSVYDDGASDWSVTSVLTPEENPVPYNVEVTKSTTSADISWNGFGDSYNVRYRKAAGYEKLFFDDFEDGLGQWTIVRNGEGNESFDWQIGFTDAAHSGSAVAVSFSWRYSAYNVDNWLISPAVTLDGTLSFWVKDDGSNHDHYDVYVSTTTPEIDQFVLLKEPGSATDTWEEVTVDLSEYNGVQGYIAIRHQDNDQNFLIIDDFGIYTSAEIAEDDWTTVSTTEKSLLITGLAPVTTYEYQIQSEKAVATTSDWTTLGTFTTRYKKYPGDVNDDAHIGIGDATAMVNLIRDGLYDEAADLDGDDDVDSDDLHELVNVKILDIQPIPAPVVSAPRRQAPMSANRTAIKPINFSVKKGMEDNIKQQKLYRTK